MAWYPAADRSIKGTSGGSYTGGPPKGILHTTEGSGAAGAIGAFKSNNSWPHFLIDPVGKVWQFLDTAVAARALRNLSGGVQTNRDHSVQVEIVGFAGKPTEHSPAQLDALKQLMRWIEGTSGVKPVGPGRPFASAYGQNHLRFTNKEWDQGSFWCGHCHIPENCVTPETPILCADFVWRQAGDLEVGDELVGFDEFPEEVGTCAGRRYKTSLVEHAGRAFKECYEVETTEGKTIATADHPWLVNCYDVRQGPRVSWVQTKDLDINNHAIYWLGSPWTQEDSIMAGYLAGLLDADGHYRSSPSAGSWVGFGQVPGDVLEEFCFEIEARGFITKRFNRGIQATTMSKQEFVDVRILGGLWETAALLGTLRPPRLLKEINFDTVVGKTTKQINVLAVRPVGVREIVSLQTSSKTYIANGMLSHNSHWDPGTIDLAALLPGSIPPPPAHPPSGFTVPASYYTEVSNVPFTISRTQGGYAVVGSDGGVFAYDAPFYGSLGGVVLGTPIVAATWSQTGEGYWLMSSDGAVFSFGDAAYKGGFNTLDPGVRGNRKPVGIVAKGGGYRIVALDSSNDGSPFDGYEFGV